jgi:hypothetical protein
VITRVPGLLAGRDTAVLVDQMSAGQARQLLLSGAPGLDRVVADGLLAVTGRWPLLLRLASRILANAARDGADVRTAGARLLERLRESGPAAVDDLLGDAEGLDVGQPAGTGTGGAGDHRGKYQPAQPSRRAAARGAGRVAEDETIPSGLVDRLWKATAGLDFLQASQVRARLADLALITLTGTALATAPDSPRGMALHDVLRDYLRAELGPQRLTELSRELLGAVAEHLSSDGATISESVGLEQVAWWELGSGDRYLRDHLIEHLQEAGYPAAAEAVACDLRWAGVRVRDFGPAAAAGDLTLVATPRAARLRAVLERTAHLLAPTIPDDTVIDILHSRAANDPDWGPQASALRGAYKRPRLVNRRPPPDLPHPALQRVLTGHPWRCDRGGRRAGWHLARRRQRPGGDGADLGHQHLAGTHHPHHPRRCKRGGRRAGWRLARRRQ